MTEWTSGRCELAFGSRGSPGVRVESVIDAPPGCTGTLEYVQLVDACRQLRVGSRDARRKSSGYILDTRDPWRSVPVASPGNFTFHADDSPGQPVVDELTFVSVTERFKTYLLWRPDGATERVSLAVAEWNWTARATRTQNSGGCAADWVVSDFAAAGGNGRATSERPTWTSDTNALNQSAELGTCDGASTAPAQPTPSSPTPPP